MERRLSQLYGLFSPQPNETESNLSDHKGALHENCRCSIDSETKKYQSDGYPVNSFQTVIWIYKTEAIALLNGNKLQVTIDNSFSPRCWFVFYGLKKKVTNYT